MAKNNDLIIIGLGAAGLFLFSQRKGISKVVDGVGDVSSGLGDIVGGVGTAVEGVGGGLSTAGQAAGTYIEVVLDEAGDVARAVGDVTEDTIRGVGGTVKKINSATAGAATGILQGLSAAPNLISQPSVSFDISPDIQANFNPMGTTLKNVLLSNPATAGATVTFLGTQSAINAYRTVQKAIKGVGTGKPNQTAPQAAARTGISKKTKVVRRPSSSAQAAARAALTTPKAGAKKINKAINKMVLGRKIFKR